MIAVLALALPAQAAPRRAASLNLCTDELLLMLAAPDQIMSVSHLSQRAAETPLWRQARRYRRNNGSLLAVAPLQPDLVLTMGGSGRARSGISERLGIRTLDLPYPNTLDDMLAAVRQVSAALGRPAGGARVMQAVAALKRSEPARPVEALWLGGGGRTLGATGLGAEWMRLAGFRQRPVTGDRIGLEELLVRPPPLVLRSAYRSGQYSVEQRWLGHPLARRPRGSRTVITDGRRWTCMGPLMIAEIVRLRAAMPR